MKYTDRELSIKIAEEVKRVGGETYYVGGLVRDEILGKENKDIDIEVYGVTTEQLAGILSQFGKVDTIGSSFGILNIHGYDIDVAQPRKENCTGRGHKDFEVFVDPFLSTKDACERRDFTINAIMKNVLTEEIVDHFGGQEDLKAGIIRHVSDQTFSEDPLRVLRAAQFAARFGFEIADETVELAKNADLTALPRERVYGELQKVFLKAERPSIFFDSMYEMNQTGWFKEVYDLKKVQQESKWHPEGNVYIHTMNTIDHAARLKSQAKFPEKYMMAAVTHDLGKTTATYVDENGRIRAIGHDTEGVPLAEAFVQRLTNEVDMCKYVTNMVSLHMQTHNNFNNKAKHRSTNPMFDKSICPEDLILLTEADSSGAAIWGVENPNQTYETTRNEREWLIERLEHYRELMKQPQLTGKDLIAMGAKPGPMFSTALEEAHRLHLSGTSRGCIEGQIRKMLGIPKPEKIQDLGVSEQELQTPQSKDGSTTVEQNKEEYDRCEED